MKVALIGASGFVGKALLNELVNRGHDVTAIARNISKIENDSEKVNKKAVDVLDTHQLAESLKGADVVISAFNPGWTQPDQYEQTSKGAASIHEAVKASGVQRYIFIGGAGSLQIDGHYLVDGPEFPKEIYPAASAVRDYFKRLQEEKELDWVYFSPAIEMHQGITIGRTGQYRLGKTAPVFDEQGRSVLSVEDLAIVLADELENQAHHREQFTAAY